MRDVKTEIKAIELLAQDNDQTKAAEKLNVSKMTISSFANTPETAEKIRDLAEGIDSIVKQDLYEIQSAPRLLKQVIDLLQEGNQIVGFGDGKAVELFPTQRVGAINNVGSRVYNQMNIFNQRTEITSPEGVGSSHRAEPEDLDPDVLNE